MRFSRLFCVPTKLSTLLIFALHIYTITLSGLHVEITSSISTENLPSASGLDVEKSYRRSRLDTRAIHQLEHGWMGRIEKHLLFLPVQIASQYLAEFYDQVEKTVEEEWISQPPVNSFTVSWSSIQLQFFSATRTIPWSFVLAFARQMVSETQNGYTGTYDVSGGLFSSKAVIMISVRFSIGTRKLEKRSLWFYCYLWSLQQHDQWLQSSLFSRD